MAEPVNGGSNTPAQPPKEMSMEVRLLLAFLLMGAVMFLMPYFFKSQVPPPGKKDAQTASQTAPQTTPGAPTTPSNAAPPPAADVEKVSAPVSPLAGATPQKPEPAAVIETDLYKIAFSNEGGTVRSWLLKKYKGNDKKTLDLVNTAAGVDFPYSLYFPKEKPASNVNLIWYKQTIDPDNLGVTYEYSA